MRAACLVRLHPHRLPERCAYACAERSPLCRQERVRARRGRFRGVRGRGVVALVVVREWFFRSAGCWGVRSAALDSSVAPICPSGPRRVASVRSWANTTSLIRRLSERSASLGFVFGEFAVVEAAAW